MLWICAVVCLPRILKVGAEGFAGRGFSRLALDVLCWPRILEVVAALRLLLRIQEVGPEGRLLAKDPKCWCCKPLAGCGCWKLALNLGAPGRLLEVWRFGGWRSLMVVCWPTISRLALYYSESFAGRGSMRLALKVVCWLRPKILMLKAVC